MRLITLPSQLVCMLDHSAMLTVTTEKYGVFDCKPLQFIWEKFKV
jgi:ubiquitin-like domain-containing CTD phosphatase 1